MIIFLETSLKLQTTITHKKWFINRKSLFACMTESHRVNNYKTFVELSGSLHEIEFLSLVFFLQNHTYVKLYSSKQFSCFIILVCIWNKNRYTLVNSCLRVRSFSGLKFDALWLYTLSTYKAVANCS